MTRIDVRLAPWTRPLLAVVATHGLTDLSQPRVFGRYACWLALPLPSRAVTVLFCLASWVHLRRELGGQVRALAGSPGRGELGGGEHVWNHKPAAHIKRPPVLVRRCAGERLVRRCPLGRRRASHRLPTLKARGGGCKLL